MARATHHITHRYEAGFNVSDELQWQDPDRWVLFGFAFGSGFGFGFGFGLGLWRDPERWVLYVVNILYFILRV